MLTELGEGGEDEIRQAFILNVLHIAAAIERIGGGGRAEA